LASPEDRKTIPLINVQRDKLSPAPAKALFALSKEIAEIEELKKIPP